MLKKGLAVAVILLFIGVAFTPSINAEIESDESTYTDFLDDGNLSGYVNNTFMNPIQGARVRVYFTASKVGYETEWILLSITENTAHDFVLTSLEPVPDLDCEGDLAWVDIKPGATVTASFTVENIGDEGSLLNWEIDEHPDWGTWTFTPDSGTGLTPEDGAVTIEVEVVAPDEPETEITGEVKIVNMENTSDFCIIDIALVINKQKSIDDAIPIEFELQRIRDLVQSIDLREIIVNPDALVDTLEEVSTILEENGDCGCEEDSSEWFFPVICRLLIPIWSIAAAIYAVSYHRFGGVFLETMTQIAESLNCSWV